MKPSFEDLVTALATTDGAYTLWIGAGASIAATGGRTPGWQSLLDELRVAYKLSGGASSVEDMPLQIEHLSESIGHAAFRRELRERLVDAIRPEDLVPEVLAAQAVIGARAASVVSFNIEPFTSIPFVLSRGGSFSTRTFLERSRYALFGESKTEPGPTAPPVYFPHGLLVQANVVMTESEYNKHLGGFAVSTATHLAIGGDLVILGMSLGDSYLRDALLKNRAWLRHVYWFAAPPTFREWARMARVTPVEVHHSHLWTGIADAFTRADSSGNLSKVRNAVRKHGVDAVGQAIRAHAAYMPLVTSRAKELLAHSALDATQITAMAQFLRRHRIPHPRRAVEGPQMPHLNRG